MKREMKGKARVDLKVNRCKFFLFEDERFWILAENVGKNVEN